jgi:hypothetical protein
LRRLLIHSAKVALTRTTASVKSARIEVARESPDSVA